MSKSKLEVETRSRNSKSKLEIGYRIRIINSKSKLEVEIWSQNSNSKLEIGNQTRTRNQNSKSRVSIRNSNRTLKIVFFVQFFLSTKNSVTASDSLALFLELWPNAKKTASFWKRWIFLEIFFLLELNLNRCVNIDEVPLYHF